MVPVANNERLWCQNQDPRATHVVLFVLEHAARPTAIQNIFRFITSPEHHYCRHLRDNSIANHGTKPSPKRAWLLDFPRLARYVSRLSPKMKFGGRCVYRKHAVRRRIKTRRRGAGERIRMAVPKKRKSQAKTRQRRTQNRRLKSPHYQPCPHCAEPKRAHRACGSCGQYGAVNNAEQVIEVWEY